MPLRALLLALALGLGGLPAGAEGAAHGEAAKAEGKGAEAPKDYVEVAVMLNDVEYIADIDISGGDPVKVNTVDLDVSDHVPGAVRISRADGASMADEGYRARDVLDAACHERGLRADASVAPILSPAGRWVFPAGCK